ncbi:MAG: hypothetical protein ACI91O_001778 [Candidatus Poriferisodalaceae bacterium]|jgi:hypothetical protein
MFLGRDLLPLMVLALGGAMLVGNVLALFKTREPQGENELEHAPFGRSARMALIGLIATIWAIATLTS